MSNESTEDVKINVPNTSHEKTPPEVTKIRKYFRKKMFQLALFIANIVLLIASLKAHKLQHSRIWSVRLWRWCVFTLSYFCGKCIAKLVTLFHIFLICKFESNAKVIHFSIRVKKSVKVFIRLGLACVAWFFLFDYHVKRTEDARKVTHRITKAILGCVIGDAIWVVKTVLVNLVGLFHVSKLFGKIKAAIQNKRTFRSLMKPEYEDGMQSVFGYDYSELKVTTEVIGWTRGKELAELTYSSNGHEIVIDEKGVTEFAKKTVQRLKLPEPNEEEYIDMNVLFKYVDDKKLSKDFEDLTEKVDGKNCIRGSRFVQWAENFYIEHKRLTEILKYNNMAIDELNMLVSVIVLIIIIIVWLLFMEFLSTKVLIFIITQLLLGTFVFGNTFKTIFESVMFVFAVHPFDIGDRVVIDNEKLIVKEMTLLKTTFLRSDDGEKSYYANSELSSKLISTWSPPTSDTVELHIDNSIPSDIVKEEIDKYIKRHPNEWHPIHNVQFESKSDRTKWTLHVIHTVSSYYTDIRAHRKSDLSSDLNSIFERIGRGMKRSANEEGK